MSKIIYSVSCSYSEHYLVTYPAVFAVSGAERDIENVKNIKYSVQIEHSLMESLSSTIPSKTLTAKFNHLKQNVTATSSVLDVL